MYIDVFFLSFNWLLFSNSFARHSEMVQHRHPAARTRVLQWCAALCATIKGTASQTRNVGKGEGA